MNKDRIVELLSGFPYSRADYWIITGGAMVMYGIKEEANDIDLGCDKKMADLLERDGYFYKYTESGNRHFKYGEHIEIFENWINDRAVIVEGFQVITIKGLIEMKEEIGREKDLKDIHLINEHLKRKGQEP